MSKGEYQANFSLRQTPRNVRCKVVIPLLPQDSGGRPIPIGCLMTLVILGLFTVLALVKIRHFGHRLFVLTLPASELPHLGILLLGLSTLLAWSEGDLIGVTGMSLIAVAVLILIGLIVLLRRALRAGPIVDRSPGDAKPGPLSGASSQLVGTTAIVSISVAAPFVVQNRPDLLWK